MKVTNQYTLQCSFFDFSWAGQPYNIYSELFFHWQETIEAIAEGCLI